MVGCIGEPISWLRLEQHVLAPDAAVEQHVEACAACRQCLDEIRADLVALPPLAIPERPRRRAWLRWLVPPLAAAVAAAILLVVVRPRGSPDVARPEVARVKGVGQVVLGVVRERGGVIRDDATRFAPGDRWKVVVTCPPTKGAWIDVAVLEAGSSAAAWPLPPARVTCGNRVVVPGAFEVTGTRANRVCVRISADAPPVRARPRPGDDGVACVTLRPE